MTEVLSYVNYEPTCDIITMAMCVLNVLLLRSTYNTKDINIRMVYAATFFTGMISICKVVCYLLMKDITKEEVIWIYILWHAARILMIVVFSLFIHYLINLVGIKGRLRSGYTILTLVIIISFAILESTTQFGNWDFRIDENLVVHENYYFCYFHIYYVFYCALAMSCILLERRKYITKIFEAVVSMMIVVFVLNIIQCYYHQTSFSTFTFEYCIIGVLFLFHHNPLERETGALDYKAFNGYISELDVSSYKMMWLHLDYVAPEYKEELSEHFFHLNEKYFKRSILFRVRENDIVLVYVKKDNPGAEKRISGMIDYFIDLYEKFRIDYRIVVMDSADEKVSATYYIKLYEYVMRLMDRNEIHYVSDNDVKRFKFREYLIEQFEDIRKKDDLDDERVLLYCQPVQDINKKAFTTGEALMRMQLPTGMVFPDEFIPVAEQFGYIHMLSRIILYKTCKYLKSAKERNLPIERLSVNFSIVELRSQSFCDEVLSIIDESGISTDMIAFELTESRNEKDFEAVYSVMKVLHERGIKFYLDDFGTGYSNFERIIGLPFDIVKFDRSMTIFSSVNDTSYTMVRDLSEIFAHAGYQLLYEGIENDNDEDRCKTMNASYLQGYKYSKPIPIMEMERLLG